MSLTNALNNAVSGLAVTARATEIIAANLANATTPGYARREVSLSAQNLGGGSGGVQVNGINRIISQSLLGDYRAASASSAKSTVAANFFTRIERQIGLPSDPNSLGAAVSRLDNALIAATSRPDNEIRLAEIAYAAGDLVSSVRGISDAIQTSRTEADREISRQVDILNTSLAEISKLNRQVIVQLANNRDASSLMDARQAEIDRISSIIPVREVSRENGRIALFSAGGAVLLDGKEPAQFSFQTAGRITAKMDGGPPLQPLVVNDEPVTGGQMTLLSGGSLGALFQLRDVDGVTAQRQIDAFSAELSTRFGAGGPDVSLPDGAAGIFTDNRAAFAPENERGLAARLTLNSMIDPAGDAEYWRLRDGLGASEPGEVGQSTLLDGLSQALSRSRPATAQTSLIGSGNITSFAGALLSATSSERLRHETANAHHHVMKGALQQTLAAEGVDSDKEMELLLQLERAYAANARVIRAADEMLAQILRI